MSSTSAVGPVRQLVMQGTPYCNIACDYCYLPDRDDRLRLPLAIIGRTAEVLAESGFLGQELDVRWHAGEPLSLNADFYEVAASKLATILGPHARVRNSIQTNGLFLNDAWMNLFKKWDFRVGVSIDGPALIHDRYRKTRKGNGTHAAVTRRLGLFASHGVEFDVISVITPVTLEHADEYLGYMAALKPRSLGINVEESEGPNQSSAAREATFEERFRDFARRLAAWSADAGIPVRELASIHYLVRNHMPGFGNSQNVPGAILTVTADGTLSTFSPELAGQGHPALRSLPIGNVMDPDILDNLGRCGSGQIADSIRSGVARCRAECEYFMFCGGGAPANKLYENGTFASTATLHCRTTVMSFAEAYLTSHGA